MNLPLRGEVWLCDLGMVAKVRPALIVSVPFGDQDYALFHIVRTRLPLAVHNLKSQCSCLFWSEAFSTFKVRSQFRVIGCFGILEL